jgi:hypothetical protein
MEGKMAHQSEFEKAARKIRQIMGPLLNPTDRWGNPIVPADELEEVESGRSGSAAPIPAGKMGAPTAKLPLRSHQNSLTSITGTPWRPQFSDVGVPPYPEVSRMLLRHLERPLIETVYSYAYSPERPGYHEYTEENEACSAERNCSEAEMADYLARYAVPGGDPDKPVLNDRVYDVYDPRLGVYAGKIRTIVKDRGLKIINSTLPGHIFHDGKVIRRVTRSPDGSWKIKTYGFGNNVRPELSYLNEWQGPLIFREMDRRMGQDVASKEKVR